MQDIFTTTLTQPITHWPCHLEFKFEHRPVALTVMGLVKTNNCSSTASVMRMSQFPAAVPITKEAAGVQPQSHTYARRRRANPHALLQGG
jgi:hypothetical protein